MRKFSMIVLVLLLIPGFLFTVSCQKKVAATGKVPSAPTSSKSGPAIGIVAPTPVAAPDIMSERIYFDYDKSVLKPEAQATLNKKVEWLKANASAKVLIEGNCDERGTNAYNIALGERRAESAKKYLIDSGIKVDRIKTISYGEEKPICPDKTEACYTKNRNDGFVVVK